MIGCQFRMNWMTNHRCHLLERGPHDGGDDGEDRFQNKNPSIDQLETMDMHDELTDISNPRILPALTKASESRFRDRMSWRFFKQHDFASICDVVDTVEAMSMDVWYAGIASDCTRRMEGVPGQMAGHHQRFQFILASRILNSDPHSLD